MKDISYYRLDDPVTYKQLDPTSFQDRLRNLPTQCMLAWSQASNLNIPADFQNAKNVLLVGMGGSAIGGELIKDLAALENSPNIEVCRDYQIPAHINKESLVIVSSYSGNTDESIQAFQSALQRKAHVLAITAGGRLYDIATSEGVPLFKIDYVGEPRTALGYSFLTPLAILQNLKIISPKDQDVEEAIRIVTDLSTCLAPDVPINQNPAKELATNLHGKLIVIFGGGLFSGVARRWKTQFNENSKAWAFSELLPDAGHNTIVGLKWPKAMSRRTSSVFLNSLSLNHRIRVTYQVLGEFIKKSGGTYNVIDGIGKGALAQILSAIMFGDYTSYYLALLNGEDPAPVTPIEHLKDRLSPYDSIKQPGW